jgi:putative peptidoglycan lipid II flippase
LFLNYPRRRFRFSFGLRHEGLRQFGRLLVPRLGTIILARTNVIVDRIFGSMLGPASVSALAYAERLRGAPIDVLVASFGTVSFVDLSGDAARRNLDDFNVRLRRYVRGAIFALLPLTIFVFILAQPVIDVLFGRGSFDEQGVALTAGALGLYSLGFLPVVINMVLRGSFFAVQDVATPLKVAAVGTVLNVGLNFLLVGPMGVRGLALATSLSEWSRMLLFVWLAQQKLGCTVLPPLRTTVGKFAVAGAAAAAVTWLLAVWALPVASAGAPLVARVGRLAVIVTAGAATYLVVCRALGIWGSRRRLRPAEAGKPAVTEEEPLSIGS